MTSPLEQITRHARILEAGIKLGVMRAHQLSDVVGDPSKSHHPDDRSAGGGNNTYTDTVPRFLSSKRRELDADALAKLESEMHDAVKCIQRGLIAADRAIRMVGEERGDPSDICAGCGDRAVLETTSQCVRCAAAERRARA